MIEILVVGNVGDESPSYLIPNSIYVKEKLLQPNSQTQTVFPIKTLINQRTKLIIIKCHKNDTKIRSNWSNPI